MGGELHGFPLILLLFANYNQLFIIHYELFCIFAEQK
jgi:hypothetical protein